MQNLKASIRSIEQKFNIDTSHISIDPTQEDLEEFLKRAKEYKKKPLKSIEKSHVTEENFHLIWADIENNLIKFRDKFKLETYCRLFYTLDLLEYEKKNKINNPIKSLTALDKKLKSKFETI